MKLKKEIVVLSALILGLAGIYILSKYVFTGQRQARLPKTALIKKDNISKIVIERKGKDKIILERQSGVWTIMPDKFKADPAKLDNMLKLLSEFKITDLVTRSGNYLPYELTDEKKITVTAFEKSDVPARQMDLGKAVKTYNHTYVKLKNDKNVYHALGSLRSDFETEAQQLRDKQIIKFDKKELTNLVLMTKGRTLTLIKKTVPALPKTDDKKNKDQKPSELKTEEKWQTAKGRTINQEEINKIIDTLADLKCDSFISGKKNSDYKNPEYTLTAKGKKEYTLYLYGLAPDKSTVAAVSTEASHPFHLEKWKSDKLQIAFQDILTPKKK